MVDSAELLCITGTASLEQDVISAKNKERNNIVRFIFNRAYNYTSTTNIAPLTVKIFL